MGKQIRKLLVPVFCWKTMEIILKAFIHSQDDQFDIYGFIKNHAGEIANSFWFLWAIFWCSLIVIVVERHLKGKVWIYVLLLLPMFAAPSGLNIYLYAYMYPYFAVGFIFHKYNLLHNYKSRGRNDFYVGLPAAALFIILLLFYNRSSYIYTTKISILGGNGILRQTAIDLYRWGIGLIGSATIMLACKMVCEKLKGSKIIGIVSRMGQISLGIYILNSYVNNFFMLRLTGGFFPSVWIWTAELVISMAFYYCAVMFIKKIPAASKLLLGNLPSTGTNQTTN